ncbi:hypothetical protein KR009_002560 [Drosophila setifemur]|nr:hypothetical protein KR009_002560 [Drosophila setifemur]
MGDINQPKIEDVDEMKHSDVEQASKCKLETEVSSDEVELENEMERFKLELSELLNPDPMDFDRQEVLEIGGEMDSEICDPIQNRFVLPESIETKTISTQTPPVLGLIDVSQNPLTEVPQYYYVLILPLELTEDYMKEMMHCHIEKPTLVWNL